MRLAALVRTIGITAIAVGLPASASAALLTLQDPSTLFYLQNENRPCVIGDSSCKSGTWGYDYGLIPPNTSPYAIYSDADKNTSGDQDYTVGAIRELEKGDFLNIGIDLNTNGNPNETLLDFFVYINGSIAFSYSGLVAFNDPTNNGTGRSDALLTGLDLSSYLDTATIQFFASVKDASDGREQFFLIGADEPPDCPPNETCPDPDPDPEPDPSPVPEPASVLLLGAAVLGGVIQRRRRSL